MKNNFAFHYVRLAPYEQIESHIQSSWVLSYVITGCGKRLVGGILAKDEFTRAYGCPVLFVSGFARINSARPSPNKKTTNQ